MLCCRYHLAKAIHRPVSVAGCLRENRESGRESGCQWVLRLRVAPIWVSIACWAVLVDEL